MNTQRRINLAVTGHLVDLGALVALLAIPLGAVRGVLVALAAVAVAVVAYLTVLRPRRWGL